MGRPFLALAALLLWAPAAQAAPRAARPLTEAESEAKARKYFTDTVLLTQQGKKVRFYSDVLKDRVVVVSFMFSQCTDACPLLTQKLRRVKDGLGDLFGKPVRFVTISVDPVNDTPEAWRKYAERNQAVHPEWLFLTGKKAQVEAVIRKLGELGPSVEAHSTTFLAGNTMTRHWTKIRPDAPAEAVVEHVRRLAGEGLGGAPAEARANR
ncbi:MAG: SCO family protein [Deltaproteobacteria bacterium]|nr:SCO family protein [Deltaproteobacteria bacterium]